MGQWLFFVLLFHCDMVSSAVGQCWWPHPCHFSSIRRPNGNQDLGTLWWPQWNRLLIVWRPRDFASGGNPLVSLKSENFWWLSGKSSSANFGLEGHNERYRWFWAGYTRVPPSTTSILSTALSSSHPRMVEFQDLLTSLLLQCPPTISLGKF